MRRRWRHAFCLDAEMPLKDQLLFLALVLRMHESMASLREAELYSKLLEDYEPLERPVANSSAPIDVKMGLVLQQIVSVVSLAHALLLLYYRSHVNRFLTCLVFFFKNFEIPLCRDHLSARNCVL